MDQMIAINKIYNEDCLDGMQKIDDKSIDLICTDLPYGQTARNKWDSVIPFEPLWEQYERIIKDNGAIILFGNGMFTADLMQSNRKLWRYNIIWEKTQPSGTLMQIRCRSGNMKISVFGIKNYLHIIRKKQADIQEK